MATVKKVLIVALALVIGIPCAIAAISFLMGLAAGLLGIIVGALGTLVDIVLGQGWIATVIAITCGVVIFNTVNKN